MSQHNEARHSKDCRITTKSVVSSPDGRSKNVPLQKRKEDAKKALYLNRV